MGDFLGSVWWMIVSLGVLVTFHEFGHYWVARRSGVRVLRFSVGFGRPLWMRRGRDGTEYVIAALPLGGYVRMLDEREGDVAPEDVAQAFNRQSVWKRIAIVAAGPVANLVLCVVLLWAMFVVGRPDYAPVVGRAEGIAAQAGLRPGDVFLKVGTRETPTWSDAALALTTAALDREQVRLQVRDSDGDVEDRMLDLARLPAEFDEPRAVEAIGLVPRHRLLPAVIGTIGPGTPAYGVLAEGDRITAIDGQPVETFDDVPPLVQRMARSGYPGMVEVERDGKRLALEVAPRKLRREDGSEFFGLGIAAAAAQAPAYDAVLRRGPIAAIPAAFGETARLAHDSLGMIGRMFSGRASLQNVSGPITIARVANASAQLGPAWFLNFLALLSLSLAIINLFPIPVLDGGHLLYYLIELVKGSPLSERAMAAGQYVGLALLAGLMGLALFNDVFHW
jgi:regulator of sigma E protease